MSKCTFGGIVERSSDRIALMRLVIPDAPSEWPKLGLTCFAQHFSLQVSMGCSPRQ